MEADWRSELEAWLLLVQTQMLIAVHRVPSWKGDQTPIKPRISHFDLESTQK